MTTTTDSRLIMLEHWLATQLATDKIQITPLAGDASFRRYFRIRLGAQTWVAMDAPPDKEDCQPFVAVANILHAHGLTIPKIIHANLDLGFLLLDDLGDELYSRALTSQNATQLYGNAIQKLLLIQTCNQDQAWHFPAFDPMMLEELQRFREWYLLKHLQLQLTTQEEHLLVDSFNLLVANGLQQPQVCTHRDYHSRNLLVLPNNDVGILDFQDAVWGPVTYDLVSLIRDCYVAWPKTSVESWAINYYQQALAAGIIANVSQAQFLHWFDWMGMQRHLKAIYIFARKFRRDNNSNYLAEIPRTLNYVIDIAGCYPEFKALKEFLSQRVLPYESNDFSSRPWRTTATTHQ